MDFKKIDTKTWFILILGALLVLSLIFGQKLNIKYHKEEIKALHEANTVLLHKNDSLDIVNKNLDIKISEVNILLEENNKEISDAKTEIERLKNKRNEIPTYVNGLFANGVANNISKYLETKKGPNRSKPTR